jgi:hypothetical protein
MRRELQTAVNHRIIIAIYKLYLQAIKDYGNIYKVRRAHLSLTFSQLITASAQSQRCFYNRRSHPLRKRTIWSSHAICAKSQLTVYAERILTNCSPLAQRIIYPRSCSPNTVKTRLSAMCANALPARER